MATIAKTKVGTSNDASICDGFALFPSRPSQRALKLGWDKRGTIFSINPSISVFKLSASADWTAMAGLCGPGYGWSADFKGSVGSSGLDLTISNDKLQAGFFFGLKFELGFSLAITSFWKTVASAGASVALDPLEWVLKWLLGRGSDKRKKKLDKVDNLFPGLIGSWGMVDASDGDFSSGNRETTLRPELKIKIGLNNFFAALKAIDEALDKVWGGFNTGPYVSFAYPTTVKLNLIKVDGSAYSDLDLIGNRITGKGGPAPGSSVKTLRIQTAHKVGFGMGVGWWLSFSACKVFSFDFEVDLPLDNLFDGMNKSAQWRYSAVENSIGRTRISSAGLTEDEVRQAEAIDVVFEPATEV